MALVFEKKKKRKHRIEWRDGAILLFEFPLIQHLIRDNKSFRKYLKAGGSESEDAFDETAFGIDYFYQSFKGWEGIIDDKGKALPVTEEYREQIFSDVLVDPAMQTKIVTAMRGPLGNLKPGTTASLNTVGTSGPADDAREVKKKKAS